MRLPFLRPKTTAPAADRARPAPVLDDAATIDAARTRARRRLVGALVLLVIGVAVFPVVFETQPRPLPLDTPIAARRAAAGEQPAVPTAPAVPAAARNPRGTPVLPVLPAESVADAGAPAESAASPVPAPAAMPMPTAVPGPDSAPMTTSTPTPSTAAPAATAPSGASAPLASQPASPVSPAASAAARFVVQIGAFTDAATLRDARLRVERLGLKTYTQVVDTPGGQRTRVRVGPFGTREEADTVAGKVKRNGLPANIVAL